MASERDEITIMNARLNLGHVGPIPRKAVVPGHGTNTNIKTFTNKSGYQYRPGTFDREMAARAVVNTRNGDGRISDSYGFARDQGSFKNGQHGDAKNVKSDHTTKVG